MAAHGGWVIVAILVCAGAAAQVRPAERYVSPDGDDAWSGTLPEPNAGRTDGPFATLARARDAVRQARAEGGLTGEATVEVRYGAYCLP